tara:strand:- start:1668 stop:2294 length:627 start_codon:yes stop_codon:yes gene_type:complete
MLFKSSEVEMIERIIGTIVRKDSNGVVLDVNGVGLKINMSINSLESIPAIGKVTQVLTYLNVKEDILDLYGFFNNIERETFLLLISISGIGPKLALTILSGVTSDNLKNSIIAGDVPSLTRVPGVGAKTAKRIIVELKEKFISIDADNLGIVEKKEFSSHFQDVLNALLALGYKNNHAKQVCNELEKEGLMKGKLESVIKLALGRLMS